jgi:hypothetical protein
MSPAKWTRAVLIGALWLAAAGSAGADIVIANGSVELRLDELSGAIRQWTNLNRGLSLITNSAGHAPFRISTTSGDAVWTSFTATPVLGFDGVAYDLSWQTDRAGIRFESRVELPAGARELTLRPRVVNTSGSVVVVFFEYPILGGIQRIEPAGGTNYELLSSAQGYLYREPFTNLPVETRRWLYPDGYGGASTQLWAYFRDGVGGFSLEARDSSGVAKNFLFNKTSGGDLKWSVETYSWDKSAGASLDPGFDFRLVALLRGDWQEAAEHYRAWALQQPWASKGLVENRSEDQFPRWLYEETYASSFGVSINLDQSRWFQALHDWVGGPMLHVSGFWWPGGTLQSQWYGGYNDWNDARVNLANITAIHQRGDKLALFLFDHHFSEDSSEWNSPAPGTDSVAPWSGYNLEPDPESSPWHYICPATSVWPAFHGWRNLKTFQNYGYDANYYDIGAGLGRIRCEDTTHGHPAGRGRWIVDAYRATMNARRDELQLTAGRYIPAGGELISELYLREQDFYQARAEASVMSMLEGDHFRGGEKTGWKQKVPLFAYLYHDVGPVRLDGNLKAAPQYGQIFYWIAGRVVAWGGLPELNYELSALEKFAGMNDPFTWYETYDPTFHVIDNSPYTAAADRGQYLGRLGRARTTFAKAWLAYGRMTRPARVVSGLAPQTVDWNLYNHFDRATDTSSGVETGAEYYERGNLTIDPLINSGWASGDNRAGLFLLNVTTTAQSVTLETDPARHDLPFLNYRRLRREDGSTQDLGVVSGPTALVLSLPSRQPVLIELAPAACTAPSCLYRIFRETSGQAAAAATTPFSTIAGHQWDDPTPLDGVSRFYLVDDGGGYPTNLQVTKIPGGVRLAW